MMAVFAKKRSYSSQQLQKQVLLMTMTKQKGAFFLQTPVAAITLMRIRFSTLNSLHSTTIIIVVVLVVVVVVVVVVVDVDRDQKK